MEIIRSSVSKSFKQLWNLSPVFLGVMLLISLIESLVPKQSYALIFNDNALDVIIGSSVGSILAGNPITSYVLAGEFLDQGVSLLATTAFMIAWVTVGVVQLPAESSALGKRFAIARNASAIILSALAALTVVALFTLFGGAL